METDLVKLFEKMHKLELEAERLRSENRALKTALDEKAEDFFKSKEDCVYKHTTNSMLGSVTTYEIFNPANVDASIRALLEKGGIKIIRLFHPMRKNNVLSVEVGGVEYYVNPYCEDARNRLDELTDKEARLKARVETLHTEVDWLEKRIEENGGQKRSRGILGFKPIFRNIRD